MRERYTIEKGYYERDLGKYFIMYKARFFEWTKLSKEGTEHRCKVLNLEDRRDRYARIYCWLISREWTPDYAGWALDFIIPNSKEKMREAQRELNELYKNPVI